MSTAVRYESYNINKYNIEISNELMDCRVFWARVISSENESLFTQYTKHTFYEIQYALEGRIGMLIGENDRVDFDESDFLIIPPDTYHQIVDGDTDGARFIMAFTVSPKDGSIARAVEQLKDLTPRRETTQMRALLSLMLQKNYIDTPLRRRQINNLIEEFLMEILELLTPQEKSVGDGAQISSEAERTVENILSFIRDYGGVGIRVSDLAARFNVSERHLNRLFVSVTGESPKEAINHEKMKRIEALASSTSLSLCEISELCGFSDEYAMNKFFRRYNRTNLSEFRKIAKRNMGDLTDR